MTQNINYYQPFRAPPEHWNNRSHMDCDQFNQEALLVPSQFRNLHRTTTKHLIRLYVVTDYKEYCTEITFKSLSTLINNIRQDFINYH